MPNPIANRYEGNDATASDNVALITIPYPDARRFAQHTIQAVAGAVDVEVSTDGGATFRGPTPLRNTAGAALASDEVNVAAAATSIGILLGIYDAILIRKKGTTNPTTVRVIGGDPVG